MLATVMNAIQLQAALEAAGVQTRVQTAIDMKVRLRPVSVHSTAAIMLLDC